MAKLITTVKELLTRPNDYAHLGQEFLIIQEVAPNEFGVSYSYIDEENGKTIVKTCCNINRLYLDLLKEEGVIENNIGFNECFEHYNQLSSNWLYVDEYAKMSQMYIDALKEHFLFWNEEFSIDKIEDVPIYKEKDIAAKLLCPDRPYKCAIFVY